MSRDSAVRLARLAAAVMMAVSVAAASCARKTPPVARPMPPPAEAPEAAPAPARPAAQPSARPPAGAPSEALREDTLASRSLDDLNREPPLRPAYFDLDSAELSPEAQVVLDANAVLLKTFERWAVTVEGHCDERGTAEYNLALGERRAVAAKTYLVSLGIAADRVRTVSYGKEMPFEKGHDEAAWAANRRAHFVITAK